MARFEVFVPAAPPKLPVDLTLRLEADHWLGALKTGLGRLGEAQASNNVLCDIQADGSIHVTDPDTGRVFRILELPARIQEELRTTAGIGYEIAQRIAQVDDAELQEQRREAGREAHVAAVRAAGAGVPSHGPGVRSGCAGTA